MNEQDAYTLERYLSKDLSAEEAKAYEERLQNEPDLAAAYQLRQEMSVYVEERVEREKFDDFIKTTGNNHFRKTRLRKLIWITGAAAAAVLIGILLLPALFEPRNLYEQFNNHNPLALSEQSGAASKSLLEGEQAFNAANYEPALRAFNDYLSQNPSDLQVLLYKGIALLELNRAEEAFPIFQTLATGQSTLKEDGTWYLALAFLKNGDYENCKRQLLKLLGETKNVTLKNKANSLLSELK